jgi:hypothetical protein
MNTPAVSIPVPLLQARRSQSVHFSLYALLFAEVISHFQNRVSSITELEEQLLDLGHEVGRRLLELVWIREKYNRREIELLGALRFTTTSVWRFLFGKVADSLERVKDKENEFIIVENVPLFTRYISVPSDLVELNCNALVGGIIRGVLEASGFPCHVDAHNAPHNDETEYPPRTLFSIRFLPESIRNI